MKNNWNYYNPVKIKAGRECFDRIGEYLTEEKWLLITTKGATKRGWTQRIGKQLTNDQLLIVYDEVTPNPEIDDLDRLTNLYRDCNICGIIALGGGSAIDTGKVLSVCLLSHLKNPLSDILRDNRKQEWVANIPVIAIPTTAGTGAEVTPFAAVWDQVENKKYSLTSYHIYPSLALLDPCMTLTLPKQETLYTALDAISHALESIWNKNRTPISEAFAWHALEIITKYMPIVLDDLTSLHARERVQQASLLSGLSISQTRTAIAHSISYPITSHYGVPHGLACSFTLPYLIEKNISFFKGRNKKIIDNTLTLLNSLNIYHEIERYIGGANLLDLQNEMYSSNRADNYIGEINLTTMLTKINSFYKGNS